MPGRTADTTAHDTPILIVGAGPTGLVLALSLQLQGVPFRIVSEAKGPGQQSRAMGVQARTLEFYRQFGIVDAVVEAGVKAATVHLREARANGEGFEVKSFSLADLGEGLSPYPFMLSYPQDAHERFLIDQLAVGGGAHLKVCALNHAMGHRKRTRPPCLAAGRSSCSASHIS